MPNGLNPFGPNANCTLDLCPVEWSVYQYRPNLGVNIMFIAFYTLAMIVHIVLGIRWKTWVFMTCMILGCVSEIIGYVGRIMLYYNPFKFIAFMLQIVLITSGPVFYTAAIYVTLSKAINHFDPSLSRVRPALFYGLFISADMFCLTLQAAGGALSTTSRGSSSIGVNLALAGLSLQVFVIAVFCGFFADYMIRYSKSGQAKTLTRREKLFFGFLSFATILILARSCYRIDELSEGYSGGKITNQGLFIALEGVLIVIAVFALCFGNPGYGFQRERRAHSSKESSIEVGVMHENK